MLTIASLGNKRLMKTVLSCGSTGGRVFGHAGAVFRELSDRPSSLGRNPFGPATVVAVVLRVAPLEVLDTVVRRIFVLVVNLRQIVGIGNECLCDEAVYLECTAPSAREQYNLFVPKYISGTEYFCRICLMEAAVTVLRKDGMRQTSDTTRIRDLVVIFKTLDVLPCFHRCKDNGFSVNHQA